MSYILWAWGCGAVVLAGLGLWFMMEYRQLKAQIAALERSGVKRRSSQDRL